ncbi:MAG: DUF1624 domain-containing protein [Phycisphaerales bacterium]
MTPETPALENNRHPERIASIDILRGLVMILMALDHARVYFGPTPFDPTDPEATTPGWFATRFVAHFCAPVFVFLAGTSAFMVYSRGMSRAALSRRLFTRGLWLILVELTIVNAGWGFLFAGVWILQVIWAIGVSMVVLSALIWLPISIIGVIGLAMIGTHNIFDGYTPSGESRLVQDTWTVLHVQQPLATFGAVSSGFPRVLVVYPLVPWIGVMAAGFAFGALLRTNKRHLFCIVIGLVCIGLFLALRLTNSYGDPYEMTVYDDRATTIMSVLHINKYPPSLQFLLLMLGLPILSMPLLDLLAARAGRLIEPVRVFGNVAMLYYILHIPLTHIFSGLLSLALYDQWIAWVFTGNYPESYTPKLWLVYAAWIPIVLLLYPVCAWYARLRRRKRYWWMTYV